VGAGDLAAPLRVTHHPPRHGKARRQELVLGDVGLEVVEPALQHLHLPEVADGLLVRQQSAVHPRQGLLVGDVVLEDPSLPNLRRRLGQQESKQVHQRSVAVRGQRRCRLDAVVERTAAGLPAERALEWLRALGESLQAPHASKEKADLMHAIYERITVAGPEIVGVRLTGAAYAHGLALALPEKVELARPTGFGRALATYEIPIEGREEWLAAARRPA